MRETTRRRYYGRSVIAQMLAAGVVTLNKAIQEMDKPQETEISKLLTLVGKELLTAANAIQVYPTQRGIVSAIKREQEHLKDLLERVRNMPVTQEEKVQAKANRMKQADKKAQPPVEPPDAGSGGRHKGKKEVAVTKAKNTKRQRKGKTTGKKKVHARK